MENLKDFSYFKTGGTADEILAPSSLSELQELYKKVNKDKTKYILLGSGSNSLILDDHFDGVVITFSNLNNLAFKDDVVTAEAGVKNSALSRYCLDHSLKGVSWLNALPGQVGATTRMNAKCYGSEMSDIVESVTSIDQAGGIQTRKGSDVFEGYKRTIFMGNREIVASISLKLELGVKETVFSHMKECEKDRKENGQFLFPSCGCVFKNNYDVGVSSGLLLDRAGAKKLTIGNACVSPNHANFIFNKGAASREILEICFEMRELVYNKFGVWMEYEMEILGTIPKDLESRLQKKMPQNFKNLPSS